MVQILQKLEKLEKNMEESRLSQEALLQQALNYHFSVGQSILKDNKEIKQMLEGLITSNKAAAAASLESLMNSNKG